MQSGKFKNGTSQIDSASINAIQQDILDVFNSKSNVDYGTGFDGHIKDGTITYDLTSNGVKLTAWIEGSGNVPVGNYNYFMSYYNCQSESKSRIGVDGVTYPLTVTSPSPPDGPIEVLSPSKVKIVISPFTGSVSEAQKITGVKIYRYEESDLALARARLIAIIPIDNIFSYTSYIDDNSFISDNGIAGSFSQYASTPTMGTQIGASSFEDNLNSYAVRPSIINAKSFSFNGSSNNYFNYHDSSFILKSSSYIDLSGSTITFGGSSGNSRYSRPNYFPTNQTNDRSYGVGQLPTYGAESFISRVAFPFVTCLYAKDYVDLSGATIRCLNQATIADPDDDPNSAGGILIIAAPLVIMPSGTTINLSASTTNPAYSGGNSGGILAIYANSIEDGATVTLSGSSSGASTSIYGLGCGNHGAVSGAGPSGIRQNFTLATCKPPRI